MNLKILTNIFESQAKTKIKIKSFHHFYRLDFSTIKLVPCFLVDYVSN